MTNHRSVKEILPRGLIVSCQALDHEPLHSSYIMSRMAVAAKEGGAIGIRANSTADIKAIKKEVSLPVIGIVKRDYADSEIYITATMKEIDEVVEGGAEIAALDATARIRPGSLTLEKFVKEIKAKYPKLFLMADCSTFEEGIAADKLGFDIVSTTLAGYTPYTKGAKLPDIGLLNKLATSIKSTLIAEGGIWTVEDAKAAYNSGAWAIVIGSAITRPQLITERFRKAIIE